jgi:starch phosphorylase
LRLLVDASPDVPRGETLSLKVAADLKGMQPSDVRVEFVARRLLPEADLGAPPLSAYGNGEPDGIWHAAFAPAGEDSDGVAVFALDVAPKECGQFATEVRIYPWHELLSHPYELGLMKWL